jgi:hypothetical protein
MRKSLIIFLLSLQPLLIKAQHLPGFKLSEHFNEQQMVIENSSMGTRTLINAPLSGFENDARVLLVFYALPNGSSIEQTIGKKIKEDDDFRFDIQHIGAQTRFLRKTTGNETLVVAYLENRYLSWPAWKANNPDYQAYVLSIVNEVKTIFAQWKPKIVLNGHSGGGRFIFSYLDANDTIPEEMVRIAFLDSSYGYEDSTYGPKLVHWLKSYPDRHLCTLAYNDSVVIYNGKPLVSPTGGTWYRSKMMHNYLASSFRFKKKDMDSILLYSAENGNIVFLLKKNPEKKIYHTTQVDLNGFIHSMLSGTRLDQKNYTYYKNRAYADHIDDTVIIPVRSLNIPLRDPKSESGSDFMKRIAPLSLDERENEIFRAAASGNIPGFLRNTVTLHGEFTDAEGTMHKVIYEAMPDYLAVGNDIDYCRIPMSPHTAQKIADLFGASLLTSKISDHIYKMADRKLTPYNYIPSGNANEMVYKFEEHNKQIETQLKESNSKKGQLVAGIKKDVILSSRLAKQPGKVVIYGWHKPDGNPIQPVYSGHIDWYVDYSHGIRFVNNQVILDGKPVMLSDILKDPVLYKIFSNEELPMEQTVYIKQ